MKESFLIYKSFYPAIEDLTNEQLGKLFRSLFQYQIDNIEPTDNDIIMAFKFFKNQFRLDENKYTNVVNRNKINGLNGGRPKSQKNPNNPVGFKEPKKPDNDNDKGKDNEKDKRKTKVFTPPSVLEVTAYFTENGYSIQSAEKAFKYYNDADWVDSKGNKVKNWKQKMQGVWFKDENLTKDSSNNNLTELQKRGVPL